MADEGAQTAGSDWWHILYDETLAEVMLVRRDKEDLRQTLGFLREVLQLQPGTRVFDQCCGIGSLSVPLALEGVKIVAVDQSQAYIERADDELVGHGGRKEDAQFIVGDAFEFIPEAPCDAVINWWTSFGYARSDARNLKMLSRACDALRKGGRLALDTINVPALLRSFIPQTRRTGDTKMGSVELIRDAHLDLNQGVLRQVWTFVRSDGGRKSTATELRLYLPHQLGAMLRQVGFVNLQYYGGVNGDELGLDSPRCIVVATKS